MKRFVEGADRGQSALFPECLEDWIGEDNPVRVIDVFADELDLGELGFGGVDPEATGRPSYHPSVLLKLYIYGYLNRVQTLQHHPHIHCIVPGGGPSLDGTRWVACRPGFFLPVRVLARLFRRLFLRELENAFGAGKLRFFGKLANLAEPQAFARRLGELRRLDWVVYAKAPFGGPEQVLAYLGRHTHRVAIANSRLISLSDGKVRFTWKGYRANGNTKVMMLAADEFIRRFLLHTLLGRLPSHPPLWLPRQWRTRR